jgi:DNA ligase-1
MKRFTNLFIELDRTNKTNEKVDLLKSYFLTAPDSDKIWALALFTGRRPPRNLKSSQLHDWSLELAGIPLWLYRECYASVGDMAETISLVLPRALSTSDKPLSEWFVSLGALDGKSNDEKKDFITGAWKQLSPYEVFVFNKLIMGSFRIGVSQTLVIRALAEAVGQEPAVIAHRVMGEWSPNSLSFDELIHAQNSADQTSRPYPFYLAYAIEGSLEELGNPEDWFAEWKWDGIRAQVIFRQGKLYIWSRGEELVTDKFPELHPFSGILPDGTVLDGEVLCFSNERPMPFNILQTRIGRKNLSKKVLTDAPVAFIAYDLLEYEGKDIRNQPQQERRTLLEKIFAESHATNFFRLSKLLGHETWDELKSLHADSRQNGAEGFMIKRKAAPYQTGRKKGDWWKWKIDPLSVDAVLIYAQKGHGRRAELYTDYTFAVWDNDKLVPFAKAYSGLTDAEIREVNKFVQQHTLEKFGPVRTVRPELVFEIGFEGISKSTRHKSGIAVRFPRILRWRKDKALTDADTLENLKAILKGFQ